MSFVEVLPMIAPQLVIAFASIGVIIGHLWPIKECKEEFDVIPFEPSPMPSSSLEISEISIRPQRLTISA